MYKGNIRKYFPKPKRRQEDYWGETDDIIKIILLEEKENMEDSAKAAPFFRGSTVEETCYNIWKWIRSNVKYVKDPDGHEKIKGPAETVADGYGDCKSMSILASSILKNLGINHAFRFTGYRKDKNVTHVYIWLPDQKICLDATYHTFNTEVPYKLKKDHMATKISRISGPPATIGKATTIPMDEYKDRGKEVPKPKFIDYSGITDGELTALLMMEQINITRGFAQDVKKKELDQAYNLTEKALQGGLSNFSRSALTGNIDPISNNVIKTLLRAKNKQKPAAGKFFTSEKKSGIGSLLIPQIDCKKLQSELFKWRQIHDDVVIYNYQPPAGMNESQVLQKLLEVKAEYEKCLSQKNDIDWLNEHLEKSAYHLLYIYSNPSKIPAAVTTKRVLHNGAVAGIGDATGLSFDNLKLWMRNGVLRTNASGGAGYTTPEKSIEYIAMAEKEGINDGGVTALVIAILGFLAAAAPAVASMINTAEQTKQQRIRASAQGIGTPQFGPEPSDFAGQNGSGNGGNGTDILSGNTPLLIGGGLLALGVLSK